MRLYHFTCYCHLPAIMAEGLSRGEVPVSPHTPYDQRPQAVSLTRISERAKQGWGARHNILDKTKIRITVEVDLSEVLSFKEVRKKYKIPPRWAKSLVAGGADPYNHYFLIGTAPPTRFKKVRDRERKWLARNMPQQANAPRHAPQAGRVVPHARPPDGHRRAR